MHEYNGIYVGQVHTGLLEGSAIKLGIGGVFSIQIFILPYFSCFNCYASLLWHFSLYITLPLTSSGNFMVTHKRV